YAELAMGFIPAIRAAAIGGARKAGKRGYWAINSTQHGADIDEVSRLQEFIAAVTTPTAGDITGSLQHEEDLFQKFAWKFLLFAEFTNLQADAGFGAGEGYNSLKSIAGALRNHVYRNSRNRGWKQDHIEVL